MTKQRGKFEEGKRQYSANRIVKVDLVLDSLTIVRYELKTSVVNLMECD